MKDRPETHQDFHKDLELTSQEKSGQDYLSQDNLSMAVNVPVYGEKVAMSAKGRRSHQPGL